VAPQYSDASGIYDASNQIEWRVAVSFRLLFAQTEDDAFCLQCALTCSDKFMHFFMLLPAPLLPYSTPLACAFIVTPSAGAA